MDEIFKVAASIGPSGLAAVAVLMVLTGWLVPKRTYDQVVASKDAQIVYLQRAHDAQADRADRLMVTAELVRTTMGALPPAPEVHLPSDGRP